MCEGGGMVKGGWEGWRGEIQGQGTAENIKQYVDRFPWEAKGGEGVEKEALFEFK